MVYYHFCAQMQLSSHLEAKSALTSRIVDECYGSRSSFSLPTCFPQYEGSAVFDTALKGMPEVDWFGVR